METTEITSLLLPPDLVQQPATLTPNHNNTDDDHHQMMQLFTSDDSNNNISNVSSSLHHLLYSPLIPNCTHFQPPQTSPTLENIDWISLFSSSSDQQREALEPSAQSVGSSTSSAPANSNHLNDNSDNSQTRGEHTGRGSNNYIGTSSTKARSIACSSSSMKKKGVPPRFSFHTKSEEDVLDDGYKWRKYGQKSVKNSTHPRSYYRCTYHTCNVKKQIQRHSRDKSIVITTYEGIHNHPCEKLMETLSPLLKQLQFLSGF